MAPRKEPNGLIRAVAYLRMSDDEQVGSIAQQREAVTRFAADNGYRIVREYVDEGISGDKTSKRVAFQRMHHDACNGANFDSILCWDQDRFGRFNSLEAGYWIHPLMQAGKTLATVNDGPIDWTDYTGRVMYQLKQEGKHQFLRDLSRNIVRGLETKAKRGEWPCGPTPRGYVVGSDGKLAFGSAEDVTAVEYPFREYAKGGSLNSLVRKMSDERIGGRMWSISAVGGFSSTKCTRATFDGANATEDAIR